MKKASVILLFIGSSLLALFGLVFLFVEARILFTGEVMVYSNPALGIFRHLFRLLSAFAAIATLPLVILDFKKPGKAFEIYLYISSFFFIILGLAVGQLMGEAPVYLPLVITVLPIFYFLGAVLKLLASGKEETKPSQISEVKEEKKDETSEQTL